MRIDMTKGTRITLFHKTSCHICIGVMPILRRFVASRRGLYVSMIDVEEKQKYDGYEVAVAHGVVNLPTAILTVDGVERNRNEPESRADLERLMILG